MLSIFVYVPKNQIHSKVHRFGRAVAIAIVFHTIYRSAREERSFPVCSSLSCPKLVKLVFLNSDLDVRVVLASGAPLAGTALLLAMFIEFRVTKNGHAAAFIDQGKGSAAI